MSDGLLLTFNLMCQLHFSGYTFVFDIQKEKRCIVTKSSYVRVDEASNTRNRSTLHITHKHLEFTKRKQQKKCSYQKQKQGKSKNHVDVQLRVGDKIPARY